MKRSAKTLGILVMAATMLVAAIPSTLWAQGKEVTDPGGSPITINPNASGTKVSGPLTIHYANVTADASCQTNFGLPDRADLFFFMRLKRGTDVAGFSGAGGSVCILDAPTQQAIITNFFKTVVVPELFPGSVNAAVAVKGVSQFVEDQPCCSGPSFAILDVEWAVKE